MYHNVGNKIKVLAELVAALGMIGSVAVGLLLLPKTSLHPWVGVAIIAAGCVIAWASSITLYGFGQLIENSDKIAEQKKKYHE